MPATGSSLILLNYALFRLTVDDILHNPDVTDAQLYERATAHLRVFDSPECRSYDVPYWVPALHLQGSKFSVKHLIEAFYHTAQDLHLVNGSRFILASICACGRLVDSITDGALSLTYGLSRPQLLAKELATLSHDVWFRQFTKLQALLDDKVQPSEALRQQLVKRDAQKCFKTADVDTDAPRPLEAPRTRYVARERLVPVPICQGILPYRRTGWERIDKDTVEFFERYLEVKDICAVLNSPRNNLLLSPLAAPSFKCYRWTLKPTQKPNRFKVVDYTGQYTLSLGAGHGAYVTFSDHSRDDHTGADSGQQGIELPNRDNLMVHAAYTSIIHRSGFVGWQEAIPRYSLMDCYLGSDDDDETPMEK